MTAGGAVSEDNDKILRMAFWDRRISYAKWRWLIMKADVEASNNTIVPSFTFLPMRWLIAQMGERCFVKRWPFLRHALLRSGDPLALQRAEAWDATWGILCVGDSQYPVTAELPMLPRNKLNLLRLIVQQGVCSVDGAAKMLRRPLSAVCRDVKYLSDRGYISSSPATTGDGMELTAVASVNSDLALFARERARAITAGNQHR